MSTHRSRLDRLEQTARRLREGENERILVQLDDGRYYRMLPHPSAELVEAPAPAPDNGRGHITQIVRGVDPREVFGYTPEGEQ